MFAYKERPYNLLLPTAVLILIASFLTFAKTSNMHLYDTYFVVSMTHSFWIIVMLLSLFWALYFLTRRLQLSNFLTWLNVILLIATSVSFVVLSLYFNTSYEGLGGMPRRYYDYTAWNNFDLYDTQTKGVVFATLSFTFALIIFIVSVVLGLLKKHTGHNKH